VKIRTSNAARRVKVLAGERYEEEAMTVAPPPAVGAQLKPSSAGAGSSTTKRPGALVATLIALAVATAAAASVGPLVLDVLEYRTSPTTLNQLLGSDAAALFVMVPLMLITAVLVAQGRRAGPLLATGLGVYALYTYAQVVIGQEYLRLPGNVERFFPLLLAVFVLAEMVVVLGIRHTDQDLPAPSRRLERITGSVLLVIAAFLVLGLHGPTMVTAYDDPAALIEYASAPTPFWMVKLMDLGIVVPAAIATGVGLLRGRAWARRVMYPLLTGYACLATSVTLMAVVMLAQDDPDASVGLALGFGIITAALIALLGRWYRPLWPRPRSR
jgi:hypothetical protein